MLILELITSLLLWVTIMIPINSYLLGINERSPYNLIQEVANQTIFDATKIGQESEMSRSDLCDGLNGNTGNKEVELPISYTMTTQNIPVKSTSTDATGIISDGKNIFVSLNSASTTDYDLMVYNYKDISQPIDKIDSGPGIIGTTIIGKNLFAINTSVNSAIQRFKFDVVSRKINKLGDYKIPWSSSNNPIYASKITSIYPYVFVGLKKNTNEELISIDLNKIDLGLTGAINKKWELNSSVQALWPMYDKYLHLLVSTALEPEINDFCLNCDFPPYLNSSTTAETPLSTFDLFGSLGNVRSMIQKDGSIYVGRSAGNNELFKINILRDYSSPQSLSTSSIGTAVPSISYDLVNSIDVNEGIYSMLISGENLMLVAGRTNSKIEVRDTENLSKIVQTINSSSTISDIECVGDKIFGIGSNYEMNGTTTLSITPIIFELNPIYK